MSLIAAASAAFGLAACTATDRGREPAGAAQSVSAQAPAEAGSRAGHPARVRAAPVAVAPVVASAVASAAVPGAPGAPPAHNQPAAPGIRAAAGTAGTAGAAGTVGATAAGPVGAPALAPSGTTGVAAQPARPHAAAARAATAAPAQSPAPPRPAPPPPSAKAKHAADPNAAHDPSASATSQIMDAVAAANMDGKAVLLDFGADWCAACKALEAAMQTPKAQAVLAQYYHVVHIDLGNADPQHMALATQYDALGTWGMPLLVVLNPDGTVRADSARTGQPRYDEAGLAAWLNQWAR